MCATPTTQARNGGFDPSITHQGEAVHCIEVTDSSLPLVVTLVWTDPSGSSASSKILVHDLDLVVTTPQAVFGKSTLLGNNVRARCMAAVSVAGSLPPPLLLFSD